ncbi:MAG: peptidase MA family metallohydrolase, partial [Chloroflexota bacterium]
MRRPSKTASPRAAAAALLLLATLALAALAAPVGVAAATPTFGTPTATATFLEGIDVTEPATLPTGVRRVEALVHTGGGTRILAEEIPLPPAGATTLRFHFATPSGSLIPNTLVEVHFRVTMDDGSMVEGPVATVRYEDTRYDWQTLAGPVVRVHWTEGGDAFGQRALAIGQKAVDEVSALLGVQETDPIDFYVYADRTAFYDVLGPGSRENVGGSAFTEIRTLIANIGPGSIDDPWVGIVIPHELTHLVFDTAVKNPYHFPPRWLNEGIAVYLSQGFDAGDRGAVERAARSGSLIPLTSLEGQFPTTADRFGLAYSESVSSIDYLVQQYGRDALVKLIRTYADGVTDDEAFMAAIGLDVAAFQAGWFESLGVAEPSPAGPQPAPSGPLPADWLG